MECGVKAAFPKARRSTALAPRIFGRATDALYLPCFEKA
jgi:hypothetical protein